MRFKRIYIEITNTCNLSCDFCIQNDRVPRQMSVAEFEHVIKEIRPYTDYVYLHVLGEPLAHPNLDAFLKILQRAHMQVNITTNGTLLKAKEESLHQGSIRQLNVSLHSFPQHRHKTYLKDVFMVCEALAKEGVHINYRLWSLQDHQLTRESSIILREIENHYRCHLQSEQIQRLQRIDLGDHLHLHFEEIFEWPALTRPFVGLQGKCLGMKAMCGILSDGSVTPCCLDSKGDIHLGNIFEESFTQIIASTRCTEMVKGFQEHKVIEVLCQYCSYRQRFDV